MKRLKNLLLQHISTELNVPPDEINLQSVRRKNVETDITNNENYDIVISRLNESISFPDSDELYMLFENIENHIENNITLDKSGTISQYRIQFELPKAFLRDEIIQYVDPKYSGVLCVGVQDFDPVVPQAYIQNLVESIFTAKYSEDITKTTAATVRFDNVQNNVSSVHLGENTDTSTRIEHNYSVSNSEHLQTVVFSVDTALSHKFKKISYPYEHRLNLHYVATSEAEQPDFNCR